MNDETTAVLNAICGDGAIPLEHVRSWIRSPNLETRGAVYRLTDVAWTRITPKLSPNEQLKFMCSYLLECVATNPESRDHLHSGFEAAWEFAAWLKHMNSIGEDPIVKHAALELEALFRRGDPDTRVRIETGALEHILEEPALRGHFTHWENDSELAPTFRRSLEWGRAHESGA